MDKNHSNKIAKYLLIIGVTLWIISCGLATVVDVSVGSWAFIVVYILIISPIIAAGYMYSKTIKTTHKRRYWGIRIASMVFVLDIVYLIVKKLYWLF